MLVADIVIKNLIGMHARPASDFIACARGFQSDVYVRNATRGGQLVDGKNLMQLMSCASRWRDRTSARRSRHLWIWHRAPSTIGG